MKIIKTNDEKEILHRMNQLRGLLAIVVLMSHLWGYTGMVLLVPFNKIVTMAVGMFFWLSGYGMMISASIKEGYLGYIYKVKIPYLLWMAVLAYLVSACMEAGLTLCGIHKSTFLPFGFKAFFESTNWYVWELIGFYIIFSLSMRFFKRHYLMFIGIVSVIAFILLYYSGLVEAYYNSIIGFWFGVFCGKESCITLIQRYKSGYIIGVVVLLLSFVGMFTLGHNTIWFALIRNFAAIGAVIVTLYVMRYISLNNKVVEKLGGLSPEIYFYHMPVALLLHEIIDNNVIYCVIVFILSIVLAVLINPVNKKVYKMIKGV